MRKRYFSTQAPDEVEKVRVVAVKRGTVTTPKGTFHMDPNGRDPIARSRLVHPDVAEALRDKGIAKQADGQRGDEDHLGDEDDEQSRQDDRPLGSVAERYNSIAQNAARRRQDVADNSPRGTGDITGFFGASAAETRSTTAFDHNPANAHRSLPPEATGDPAGDDDGFEPGDDGMTYGEGLDGDEEKQRDPASTDTGPADAAMREEGNAPGGDSPPLDDDAGDDAAGESSGATEGQADAAQEPVKPARKAGRPPKTSA